MIRFILDGGYQTDVQEVDDRQLSPLWYAYVQNQCLFRPACRPSQAVGADTMSQGKPSTSSSSMAPTSMTMPVTDTLR
jgi:hypothetical protein